MTNLDSILKSRDITLPTKVHLVKASVFPVVMHLVMHDHKESWMLKNWCFWTVGLEKTFESLLDSKEIKPVNPKGNQSWILIGRTDAEVPILWPSDAKSCLVRKDPMLERLKARREKDDRGRDGWMVSLTQRTWVWASSCLGNGEGQGSSCPGNGEGQGSLECCRSWGRKESDITEWLNNKCKILPPNRITFKPSKIY